MGKWSFNEPLFSRLSDVLDISGAEIARRCGLTQQVLNRYMNSDIVLSVQVLMKICNALRMPAHYFVSEDNNHVFPNREVATIPYDCWHPIEWDSQAAELTFGDGEGRIYWKDVAEVMNVSAQKPHERFLLRKRFPIDGFLTACSHFNISPFRFLIDPNRDCGKKAQSRRQPLPSPGRAEAVGDEALRAEVRELTGRLADLNSTVSDITKKYEALLQRHTALLDRHNELERTVRDYLGLTPSLMAAEDRDDM